MENVGRVYIDTNIFIAGFETRSGLAERIAMLFSSAPIQTPPRFVTSELTLGELLVRPYRNHDTALIDFYDSLISSSSWLEVRPVTREVLSAAASCRARDPARKLPDAVHIATADLAGCSHLLSADKGVGPAQGESLPFSRLQPDEQTIEKLIESLGR